MSLGILAHSVRQMKSVTLGVALVCGATFLATTQVEAGSGVPANQMFSKKAADTNGEEKQTWSSHAVTGGKATTTSRIVDDGSVAPFLASDSTAGMQAMADKYSAIVAAGGWPKVPSGKLKKSSSSKAVALLNKRLNIEGYLRVEATAGEFAEVYTSATEDAVRRFQTNHGLAVTGTIDGPTLAQLNVPADRRLATIRANIPRVAEYSKDLGSRYVIVNIPAQQIETVNEGRVFSLHNAIVGRPSRPTPVVMAPLTMIRFNPYWNAPPSIVERDILPRMLSTGPSKVMASMNMKIFDGVGGPEVSPNSVNWRRAVVDNYHFRQEPGGSNAMATAKIDFNSPFGIYLHDTPEPQLFNSGERLFSSGCVRVQNVSTLINWVLQGQDGINSSRISELAQTRERLDETIENAPQLRVAYLTSWPAHDGVAAFRRDVYELDGTGFVLGQPLPVGETNGGQRYVLKPIPRSLDAVDADEAFGFASLFRSSRNPDKQEAAARPSSGTDDTLLPGKTKTTTKTVSKTKITTKTASKAKTTTKTASKTKAAKKSPALARITHRNGNDDKEGAFAAVTSRTPVTTVKKVEKKSAAKSKKSTTSKNTTTAKKVAQCKPGADGKLPSACKATTAAKKPVARPEKTAAAK